MSQDDLAAAIGITAFQTISDIERCNREVRASELTKIAKALSVTVSDLLQETEPDRPPILWRKRPEDARRIEADFLLKCQQYKLLEDISGQTRSHSFPEQDVDLEKSPYSRAAELALSVGQEFNLGSQPAVALAKVLEEKYNVKIWHADLGMDGSAACTIGSFGPAILMNLQEAPWRRNFNFAHELFHLVTWKSIPPSTLIGNENRWTLVEKLANAFAAAVLLPADLVIAEFERRLTNGKIKVVDLIDFARRFEISTEALLWRLVGLRRVEQNDVEHLLADEDFRTLDRVSMRGKWFQPPKFPEKYVRLAVLAYQRASISRAKIAHLLETSLLDLPAFLQQYGLDASQTFCTELPASG